MKRRDFFKAVTGFVAGIFAAFVPKAKAKEWTWVIADYNGKDNSDGIEIYPKRITDWQAKTWIATREQLAALGRGDCGWMQTYGICCDVPPITEKESVHLNISI